MVAVDESEPVVRAPHFVWAQRRPDVLVLTVRLAGLSAKDVSVTLTPDGLLGLRTAVDGVAYELELELFGRILVEDSVWAVTPRAIVFRLRRDSDEPWPRLHKHRAKKLPNEAIDWDLWQEDSDSDDDEGARAAERLQAQLGMGSMPFVADLESAGGSTKKKKKRSGGGNMVVDALREADVFDLMFYGVLVLHILLAPYTKVEESFNTQAVHDAMYHTSDIAAWDHHEFPGVVPRTCLGALSVAALASPYIFIGRLLGVPKVFGLYTARFCMGLVAVGVNRVFRTQVERKFGYGVALAYLVLTMCQFHLPFYWTRPLPNTFALNVVMVAYAFWLRDRYTPMMWAFIAAVAIFRAELVLLFVPILVSALYKGRVSLRTVITTGVFASAAALVATIAIDSLFWGKFIYPEGVVFYFNVFLNKSHEWGTSPFHWYFTSALPRALLGGLFLAPVGAYLNKRIVSLMVAPVVFVVVYSILPHKELRFILYVLPIFNVAAAIAINWAFERAFPTVRSGKDTSASKMAVFWTMAALVVGTAFAASFFLFVSSHNYPGGDALAHLHATHGHGMAAASVHIDVAAAQQGVSRFLERDGWTYSKEEDLLDEDLKARGFDFLVTEAESVDGYQQIHAQEAFAGISRAGGFFPAPRFRPAIFVHQQIGATRGGAPATVAGDDIDVPDFDDLLDEVDEAADETDHAK